MSLPIFTLACLFAATDVTACSALAEPPQEKSDANQFARQPQDNPRKQQSWKKLEVLQRIDAVGFLTFVYQGNTLLTASSGSGFVGSSQATLWDLSQLGEYATIYAGFARRYFYAVSPDGLAVATDKWDYELDKFKTGLALWDLTLGEEFSSVGTLYSPVRSLAFMRDGKTLASGHYDKIVRFWDISADKKTIKLRSTLDTQKDGVTCLAFTQDGKTLVTGSYDKSITVWDIARSKALATLTGHHERLIGLEISPDGKTLASVSGDGGVKIWDLSKLKERFSFQGIRELRALAFSPDGKSLAFCVKGKEEGLVLVKLCDPVSGKEVTSLEATMDQPMALAFRRDGKMLALGGFGNNPKTPYPIPHGIVTLWKME
jgi:WD40 repeat protein